jgi:hypothetical protein
MASRYHVHFRLSADQKKALDQHLRDRGDISIGEFFRRHVEQVTGKPSGYRAYRNMRPDAPQRSGVTKSSKEEAALGKKDGLRNSGGRRITQTDRHESP